MLNAHWRQQGPSCAPVHFSVAGLWPQKLQSYVPRFSSITSNITDSTRQGNGKR